MMNFIKHKPEVTPQELGKVLYSWIYDEQVKKMILDESEREELDIKTANPNLIFFETLSLYLFLISYILKHSKLNTQTQDEVLNFLNETYLRDAHDRLNIEDKQLEEIKRVSTARSNEYARIIEQNAQPNFLYWLAKTCIQHIKSSSEQIGLTVTTMMSARISVLLKHTPKLIDGYKVIEKKEFAAKGKIG